MKLSLAGRWYGYISLPIFQFLLIRSDQLGGLGFLAGAAHAFALLAAAHGAMLTGPLANRIFYLGANLMQFKAEVILLVAFLAFMVYGPLLAFTHQLDETKRRGKREYDTLAQGYVRDFEAKWLRGGTPEAETLLGSGGHPIPRRFRQ